MSKTCIICEQDFLAKARNAKTCSKACRISHRKNRNKTIIEREQEMRSCAYCSDSYATYNKRKTKFCSRSCGAKWNIEQGNCESWRQRKNIRKGLSVKCAHPGCSTQKYLTIHQIKERNAGVKHCCSSECRYMLNSIRFSGRGNPMYGKPLTDEQYESRKQTMLKRYGVKNAYMLARHKCKSKGEDILFEELKQIIPESNIQRHAIVRDVAGQDKYIVDFKIGNIIVEYFGDYWHANPVKYEHSHLIKKKNKLSSKIWIDDSIRIECLISKGLSPIVVWENDFKDPATKSLIVSYIKRVYEEKNINDM